jgi:hypothetical protein
VTVTSPEEGRFVVTGAGESLVVIGEERALDTARERARTAAARKAQLEGADDVVLSLSEDIDAPDVEGSRRLVEARITATATGRPRIVQTAN